MSRGAGCTLIASLVALTVIGMAAAALSLAERTTMRSPLDWQEQRIALGLALQLIAEVLAQPYHAADSSPWEAVLREIPARERFFWEPQRLY